jgi:hypothetical protein
MERHFPIPAEERGSREERKWLTIHERAIRTLKSVMEKQDYRVYRTPNSAGDIYACKGNEVIIVEVKKIHIGSLDMHPVIHGAGQLLYYDYLFHLEKESKERTLKLWLAFPFNAEAFKKYYSNGDFLRDFERRAGPFLNRFRICLVPILMEKENWVVSA